MNDELDEAMEDAFETLEPVASVRVRMEEAVLAAHAINQRSLAAEWLELFRAGPVSSTLLLGAATATLIIATPLGLLLALATQMA